MASPRIALVALLLLSFQPLGDASTFLQKYVSLEDVEQTLTTLSVVSASDDVLLSIENGLRPMFAALPKNSRGNLEPSVVRYALHRFFVQRHGWYMRGLDPNGAAWHTEAANSILTDRAPAYIQSLFEERLHGRGMGLSDLAVFAAAMSDLVHKEASQELLKVYSAMKLPTVGAVTRFWSEAAVKGYLMGYLIGGDVTATNLEELQIIERELVDIYPDWDNTYMWVQDFREAHDLEQQSK